MAGAFGFGDEGQDVWLDGRDASQSRQAKTQMRRSSGKLPKTSGSIQNFGNHKRYDLGRLQNHRHNFQAEVFQVANLGF